MSSSEASSRRVEIAQIVPALMLLPERNLFDDLIREVEEGGDNDPAKQLRTLGDINDIDPANGSDWKHIARKLGN